MIEGKCVGLKQVDVTVLRRQPKAELSELVGGRGWHGNKLDHVAGRYFSGLDQYGKVFHRVADSAGHHGDLGRGGQLRR
jgi:hypothetical protein